MSFVDGLDLSLTSTGLAAVNPHDGALHTVAFGSTGRATDTFADHLARQIELCDRIVEAVEASDPVLVVMESATFTTPKDTSAHRRAGLWWRVFEHLSSRYPVVTLTPAEVKLFATGKGNAGKDKVLAQTFVAYGVDPLPSARYDRADATVLASVGSAYLGGEQGFAPTAYRDAVLDKLALGIEWPQTVGPRVHRDIITAHRGV